MPRLVFCENEAVGIALFWKLVRFWFWCGAGLHELEQVRPRAAETMLLRCQCSLMSASTGTMHRLSSVTKQKAMTTVLSVVR